MYCKTCLDALQKLRNVWPTEDQELCLIHHETALSLKRAAMAGCHFCYVFWDQFTQFERKSILDYDEEPTPTFAEATHFPDRSDDSDHAWEVRKERLKRSATLCLIQPGEHSLRRTPERFRGSISFSIVLNPERDLPPSGQRSDLSMFLLDPVHTGTAFDLTCSSFRLQER